jgi:hypothetical protein
VRFFVILFVHLAFSVQTSPAIRNSDLYYFLLSHSPSLVDVFFMIHGELTCAGKGYILLLLLNFSNNCEYLRSLLSYNRVKETVHLHCTSDRGMWVRICLTQQHRHPNRRVSSMKISKYTGN